MPDCANIASFVGPPYRQASPAPPENLHLPMRTPLAVTLLLFCAPLAAAPRPAPKRPAVPLTARYTISTSAQDMESLRAESRLAQFVRALQEGRRAKAATYLSSRVGPDARRALVEKRWLPARVGARGEFNQLLFWRDIQIRTQRVHGERRDLVISPRRIPFNFQRRKGRPTGILEVPMLKEQGQWWVDLRPAH